MVDFAAVLKLARMLAPVDIRWPTQLETFPFPHVVMDVMDGFLPDTAFLTLRGWLDSLLRQGLSEQHDRMRLSKMPGYDCYCWLMPPNTAAPGDIFIRRELQDHMGSLFHAAYSGEVTCQFNYHAPGARDGSWHTDYVVGYHTEQGRAADGVNVWNYGCNLLGGNADVPGRTIVARTRSLAFLYYLGAEQAGQTVDGGATALGYQAPQSPDTALFRAVAPIPNRLLAFECSPLSLHRMLSNRLSGRALLIGWLHSTPEAALARHGAAPEFWCPAAVRGQYDFNAPVAPTRSITETGDRA